MADLDSNNDDLDLIALFCSRNFDELQRRLNRTSTTSIFQKNTRFMAKHLLKPTVQERLPVVQRLRENNKHDLIVTLLISELRMIMCDGLYASLTKDATGDKPLRESLGKVLKEALDYFNVDIPSQLVQSAEIVSKDGVNLEVEFDRAAKDGNAVLVCFILFHHPEFATRVNVKNETLLFHSHPMFWRVLIAEFKVPPLELNTEHRWFMANHAGEIITWTRQESYFIPITDKFCSRGKTSGSSSGSLKTIVLSLGIMVSRGECFRFALEYEVDGSGKSSEPQYFVLPQAKPHNPILKYANAVREDLQLGNDVVHEGLTLRKSVIQAAMSAGQNSIQDVLSVGESEEDLSVEENVVQDDLSIGLLLANTIYNRFNQTFLPNAIRSLLDTTPSRGHHPSMIIPFVGHQSVAAFLKRSLNINTRDSDGKTALHYIVTNGDNETLQEVSKEGEMTVEVKNRHGNTPLHACDARNHAMVNYLLGAGADFYYAENADGVTFMMSSHEAMEVIRTFLRSKDSENAVRLLALKEYETGLKCIADSMEDGIISLVVKKLIDFYKSSGKDITKDWVLNGNGQKLLAQIWESRIVKKKTVLVESYNLMLRLFSYALDNDKKAMVKYCHGSLDVKMRMSIMHALKKVLPKDSSPTYLAKESLKSGFMLFIFLNLSDFVSDAVLTYDYYYWPTSAIVKQYPVRASQCIGTKRTLACNIHSIDRNIPFWYSIIVLTLPFMFQALLIVQSTARMFISEMAGYCCKDAPKKSKVRMFIGGLFAICLQPIATQYYSFVWRKRLELQVSNRSKIKLDKTTLESHDNCYMHQVDDNHLAAKLLQGTTKLITACTENYFMPLLQLHILFPMLSMAFAKTEHTFTDPLDFISKVSRNWQYYLTVFSIITSILSLSATWTFVYFTKPTKIEEKSFRNVIVYFVSVLFQCISRLLAFEIALSVFALLTGYSFLVMLLLIVVVHSLVTFMSVAVILLYERRYRTMSAGRGNVSIAWESACTALTSLYIFNEIDCEKTAFDNMCCAASKPKDSQDLELEPLNEESLDSNDQSNRRLKFTLWLHGIFVVENLAFAGMGWLITDSNYNAVSFFTAVCACETFGLVFKSVYYLFLHPWKKLKTHRAMKKYSFVVVVILIYIICLAMVGHAVPQALPAVVAVGVISLLILLFLLFFFVVTVSDKKRR